jgi:DNA-directed RNA polymerase specialized sigma24 family protein
MAPDPDSKTWSLDEAFPLAFERELSYVFQSLRRLGIPSAHVEDVAQEVFLKAFLCFGLCDRGYSASPFGLRPISNVIRQ